MDNLLDLASWVGDKLGRTNSPYITLIKAWINDLYEDAWNKYLWTDALVFDHPISATSGDVFTPWDCDRIVYVASRVSDLVLDSFSAPVFTQKYLQKITASGYVYSFTKVGTYASNVEVTTAAGEQISVESSSASDTTQTIRIEGKDSNGIVKMEQETLNGTSAQSTTQKFYGYLINVSKSGKTVGDVIIKANGVEIGRIPPTELSVHYRKIKLWKAPTSETLYITYKKRFRKLEYDDQAPLIPALNHPLKLGGFAHALEKERQFGKAQTIWAQYKEAMSEVVSGDFIEESQTELAMPVLQQQEIDTQITL